METVQVTLYWDGVNDGPEVEVAGGSDLHIQVIGIWADSDTRLLYERKPE